MKETKTTTRKSTAKKTTPKKTTTKPAVKPSVKDVFIEENFLDEEETDKRLIVFAVIAILVVLATIVTLVIGCDRKKEEDTKKPTDDIVVPEKKDEEEDEGVDTPEIVRKVTTVYRGRKTKESTNTKKKNTDTIVEDEMYYVTYYLGDETKVIDTKEGDKPEKYVPDGYSTCKYYKESEITDETEEFDMEEAITGDVSIYMSCNAITYHVVYDQPTSNLTEYTVEGNDITLDNESYEGWYKENTFENLVTVIDKSMIGEAKEVDGEYYIYLFAKPVESEPCQGPDCAVDPVEPETPGQTGDATPTDGQSSLTAANTSVVQTGEEANVGETDLSGTNNTDPNENVQVPNDSEPSDNSAVVDNDKPSDDGLLNQENPSQEDESASAPKVDVNDDDDKGKQSNPEPSVSAPKAPAVEPPAPKEQTNNENENKTEDNSGENEPEEGSEE